MFSPETINKITNVVAFLLAILEPVRSYLSSQPFDWLTFAITVLGAVVAYFTGKGAVKLKQSSQP